MADHTQSDDDGVDDFAAAYAVGEKVIEMADRLRTAEKFVPGARATWASRWTGSAMRLL